MLPSPRQLKPDYGLALPRWHEVVIWSSLAIGIISVVCWRVSASLPESFAIVCPYICFASLIVITLFEFLKHRYQLKLFRMRKEVVDAVLLKGEERVLVLYSGLGFMVSSLAQKMTTGRVVGIDPRYASSQIDMAITNAEENVRREGVAEKVELYSDELSPLPFPENHFDVAVMIETDALATKTVKADEVIRVMKSGGKLYINYNPATEAIIATMLLHGFSEHSEARFVHSPGNPILLLCLQKQ